MMPLDGLRVLDWTICTAMLGDLGAEVIKIEQRGTGDPGRWLAAAGGAAHAGDLNWYFEANNRNKQSIALDLKKPEAREVVLQLAERSDVFVQNFRKGVAARLGLDYASLRARNPRIIYASATGYGPDGPESGAPSFDHLGLARSGIMNAAGEPDMPPLGIAGGVADQMGGAMLAYGIMTALLARERHGVGQEVNVSHLGSMAFLQGLSLSMRLMAGRAFPRSFRSSAFNPLWNHYRCADDAWLALAMLQSDRYWVDFCAAVGLPELAADPRFADMNARAANAGDCVAALDAAFATRPRAEWLRILDKAPGDFIYTIVNSVEDLPDDPQMQANGYIARFHHPQHGETPMVGLPIALSQTPGGIRIPAPELGQHTEQILLEVLGWDWPRITALRESEAI